MGGPQRRAAAGRWDDEVSGLMRGSQRFCVLARSVRDGTEVARAMQRRSVVDMSLVRRGSCLVSRCSHNGSGDELWSCEANAVASPSLAAGEFTNQPITASSTSLLTLHCTVYRNRPRRLSEEVGRWSELHDHSRPLVQRRSVVASGDTT